MEALEARVGPGRLTKSSPRTEGLRNSVLLRAGTASYLPLFPKCRALGLALSRVSKKMLFE